MVFGSLLVGMLVAGLFLDRYLASRGQFGWCGGGLVCLFGIPALIELVDCLAKAGAPSPVRSTVFAGALLLIGKLLIYFLGWEPASSWFLCLTALLSLFLTFQLIRVPAVDSGGRRFAGVAAALVFAVFVGFLIDVGAQFGTPILFALVLTTKAGDIGAYLTGRFLGRHQLIVHISPNKTVEGAIGGFVLSVATGVVLFRWLGDDRWSVGVLLAVSFFINLGGILGDLIESLVKRAANVKDSGNLVPEFGGALDMLDSLFLAAPVGAALLSVTASQ